MVDPDSQYGYDDAGTSGLPQVTLTYGYDGVGNRTSLADSLGGRTTYTYDERDEVTQIRQSGSGVAANRPRYLQDRLNTVRDLVDNTGSIIDHIHYQVFGKVAAESSPANGDRRKCTGCELDAAGDWGLGTPSPRSEDDAPGSRSSETPATPPHVPERVTEPLQLCGDLLQNFV